MGSGISNDRDGNAAGPSGRGSGRIRQLVRSALPGERFGDHLTILSGTGQNIAGLAVYVLATFGSNILIARALGKTALGVVTLTTQFAFVAGAGTRFGMDMAAVRSVAIDVGKGEPGRARAVMSRAVGIAALVSLIVGGVIAAGAGGLARQLGGSRGPFEAAAVAVPFVALCQVYLGGTRGLKIMRHTLYVFWVGQPVLWIALMLMAWTVSKSTSASVLAYAGSWVLAAGAAWFLWMRETEPFATLPAEPGELGGLLRYGAPRAPAALLAQLLFWADYFVFSRYAHGTELGVYAAAVRVAQALVLFLIAVNYMFSPFVADLYARGERDRLDGLFKALTRWVVAGTVPILLLLAIAPGPVLLLFGGGFQSGTTALRILLIGQSVNVATGSVGFILIMVGRTGWDLLVYAASILLDLVVAFLLAPHLHANGAAIAQAVTLMASNGARLWLVWRFVHIQPFNRHYLRLAIPAGAGAAVMGAVHLALHGTAWWLDLVATGALGLAVYAVVLLLAGLTPTERAAVGRLVALARGQGPAPAT